MLGKLTFGNYNAGSSIIHKLDARAKLLMLIASIVTVFLSGNLYALSLCALLIFLGYYAARINPKGILLTAIPMVFTVIVTMLFNLFFVQGGETIFHFGFITISEHGASQAIFIGFRLSLLLMLAALYSATTSPLDISKSFEFFLHPFARFGFPARQIATMAGLAVRFLPIFVLEFVSIYNAQISRGASVLSATNPIKSAKILASFTSPLIASAFRKADVLAQAMDSRGYDSSANDMLETRLAPMKFSYLDLGGTIVIGLWTLACIALTAFL